ncbi:MAG: penicillin-binding protein activator LpoB [Candidatus Cloacimonetes bacterium]|nr:penicillin-binding protein activator LpoB [Candidatus Cloacimonadota bacterium]MDD2506113.1 penicillin-binding protein activator LpoB [Candidatus Cloacimonadota bacterium]MDD4559738.1 penicillin-binding protein activator LpoB [Candidatus Cloacimonadota bacterium]
MQRIVMMVVICLALLVAACGPSVKVQRVPTDTVADLSGKWNSTDSRLVAEEMIRDVVSRPWLSTFQQQHGRSPVVIIGTMRNLSSEHIEMGTFVSDISRELINSGAVRFVASKDMRDEVRDERTDQQYFASEETAKRMAQELGADYMLKGTLKTIMDSVDRTSAKYYQVDLELIDVETTETVWIGNKEIMKLVERNRFK